MIIDCDTCDAKVDAKVLIHKDYGPSEEGDRYRVYFLECPVCDEVLVGKAAFEQVDEAEWEYQPPYRLWPAPAEVFSYDIPDLPRNSLEEAQKCFRAQAYAACAVMCGRAVEAICAEYKTKSKNLGAGLKELRDKEIIDPKIFQWGESLREHRNLSAHATGERVTKADAKDLMDFAHAICEYVFILSQKYEEFKQRQAKRQAKKTAAASANASSAAATKSKTNPA